MLFKKIRNISFLRFFRQLPLNAYWFATTWLKMPQGDNSVFLSSICSPLQNLYSQQNCKRLRFFEFPRKNWKSAKNHHLNLFSAQIFKNYQFSKGHNSVNYLSIFIKFGMCIKNCLFELFCSLSSIELWVLNFFPLYALFFLYLSGAITQNAQYLQNCNRQFSNTQDTYITFPKENWTGSNFVRLLLTYIRPASRL